MGENKLRDSHIITISEKPDEPIRGVDVSNGK